MKTWQGNGAGDMTTINLVTTPAPPNPNYLRPGPPSIDVTQGSGSGDSAKVTNSTLPGNICITQTDVAGNARGDSATISGDKVGFTVIQPAGQVLSGYFGNQSPSPLQAGGIHHRPGHRAR